MTADITGTAPADLLAQWYGTVWGTWDAGALEEIAHPDLTARGPLGVDCEGFDLLWMTQGALKAGFADLRAQCGPVTTVDGQLRAPVRWTGTHTGHIWRTEATGTALDIETTVVATVDDGRLRSVVEDGDPLTARRAIGAPEPAPVARSDQRIIPTLRSSDWEVSRPFYRSLGARVVFEWRHAPDFPVYAGIELDGLHLHVSEHAGDCQPGSALSIVWQDLDGLHARLAAAGTDVPEPVDQPWGDRALDVEDPDGNRLTFFHELPS